MRVANGTTTHFLGEWYEYNVTTSTPTVYYPLNGVPIAMKQGSTLSYLHHDHLGSLVSARYYDVTIGRFHMPDTIVPNPSNPQTLNRYAYVDNNPLKYGDGSGHTTEIPAELASPSTASCRSSWHSSFRRAP